MNNNFRFLFFTAFILFFTGTTYSQIITSNDGFEGTPAHHVPPPGWNNCEDGNSTVDTQPGPLHNTMPASQGATYISMVTREMNPPGTAETLWADLLTPFLKDHSYTLMLDLTLSHEYYGTLNWQDYYFNNPCRLQILGFNGIFGSSSQTELLWQSEVIDHFEWQNYEIPIGPLSVTYERIALRVEFTDPGNFKNSALMIDNLRCKEMTNPGVLICYPNPTSDHVTFEYLASMDDDFSISVIDNTGREVSSMSGNINTGNNKWQVPMENLATGNYFVLFTLSDMKSIKLKVIRIN